MNFVEEKYTYLIQKIKFPPLIFVKKITNHNFFSNYNLLIPPRWTHTSLASTLHFLYFPPIPSMIYDTTQENYT